MEKHVKDEILRNVDELVVLMKNCPEFLRFQEVTKSMKNNEELNFLMNKVKRLQKQIVNMEYRGQDIVCVEKELNDCLNELDSYPIYQEYCYLLEDLNNMFQSIKNILEEYINNIVK